MTKWDYAEAAWQPSGVRVTFFSAQGDQVHTFAPAQWGGVLARLGGDGWELVSVMASPTGIHEYWYYFKKPQAG